LQCLQSKKAKYFLYLRKEISLLLLKIDFLIV